MPRTKWIPKCSYCRGSHLTDPAFEMVLYSFILGMPAEKAHETMQKLWPKWSAPSEKTIRRHYRRIGDAVYELILEEIFLRGVVGLRELKKTDPARYKEVTSGFLERFHTEFMPKTRKAPLTEAERVFGDTMAIYQLLSARKKGVRGSIKEHMALAVLRDCFRRLAGENFAGARTSRATMDALFEWLKIQFKKKPC